MRKIVSLIVVLALVTLVACKKNYMPKPSAYYRIDEVKHRYVEYDAKKLTFEVSSTAVVGSEWKGNQVWLTIRYPQYRACLYCTYLPVNRGNLRSAIDDNYRMAFSHTVKADGIAQKVLSLPQQKSGGILYAIGGDVATPRQFYLTDSVAHFFRASLYFDGKANADSLLPVVVYLDKNIQKLIATIRWK